MRGLLRTYSGALFLAFPFFLNLALPSRLNAAGFSGLEGTQLALKIAADAQADLNSKESATGGRISAVTVSRDTERQLTLSLAFAGLEGKTIEVLVRDGVGAIQTDVPSKRAVMDAFSNPRELTLELKQDLPLNATLESAVLQILVFQPSDPIPSLVYTWQLGKKWKAKIDPENVIVRVGLRRLDRLRHWHGELASSAPSHDAIVSADLYQIGGHEPDDQNGSHGDTGSAQACRRHSDVHGHQRDVSSCAGHDKAAYHNHPFPPGPVNSPGRDDHAADDQTGSPSLQGRRPSPECPRKIETKAPRDRERRRSICWKDSNAMSNSILPRCSTFILISLRTRTPPAASIIFSRCPIIWRGVRRMDMDSRFSIKRPSPAPNMERCPCPPHWMRESGPKPWL